MRRRKILLALALAFVFAFVYSPHLEYSYPFHVDEWHHIELAMKLASGERIEFMEIGFDAVLAVISMIGDLVKVSIFLPALIAAAASAILFYYLNKRVGFAAGIMAMLLFASLKCNSNILGLCFLVPVAAAVPLAYLALFIFEEALNEGSRRKMIASLIIVAFAFTVHPPSALIAIIGGILLAAKKKKQVGAFAAYSLVLAVPIFLYFILGWKGSFAGTARFFLQYAYFPEEFNVAVIHYNPLLLLGIFPSLLALAGLVKSFKTGKMQQFSFIFLFALANIAVFEVFGVTFAAHYSRMVFLFMVSAVPLAAYGFSAACKYFYRISRHRVPMPVLAVIIAAVVLLPSFITYGRAHPEAEIYTLLDPNEIPSIEFLKTLPSGSRIVTPLRIGNVLYPLAGIEPVASIYWHGQENAQWVGDIYEYGCAAKENAVIHLSAGYVFSPIVLNCDFLVQIYADKKSGIIIYKVRAGQGI